METILKWSSLQKACLRFYQNLFSVFVGGRFVLRRLKSEEGVAKLKSGFWAFVSSVIEKIEGVKA
jgi:hypothetical protein